VDTTLRNSKQQYNNEEMFSINYLKISIFFYAHVKCDVRELKKKYLECEMSPKVGWEVVRFTENIFPML